MMGHMKELLAGYRRFRGTVWPRQREAFEALGRHGQSPKALVITCIDSRVDPAMIFDTAPGDLLTLRNVANLVPPYAPDAAYHGTSAAIEFGVRVLAVQHLLVLGHGLCGGVKALLERTPNEEHEFIATWMSLAESARLLALRWPVPEERQQCCEQEVIRIALANLMTFPWIAERVATADLELHGAWFDIRTGVLTVLDADGSFAPGGEPLL